MQSNNAIEMIKKMKAGIEHQARTNADNIVEQAKQDSERLKSRTVYQARSKIKEENKLKKKQIREKKSVQLSIANGKQRMKVLHIRNDTIDSCIKQAEEKLIEISNSSEYKSILISLCVQGLLNLLEEQVELAVKKSDATIIQENIQEIERLYKEKSEKDCKVSLSSYVVPDECIGGVVLITNEYKIQLSNTLKDRLHLACKDLYPQIREVFFNNE